MQIWWLNIFTVCAAATAVVAETFMGPEQADNVSMPEAVASDVRQFYPEYGSIWSVQQEEVSTVSFTDLAPQQKLMGILQLIATIRTKIVLLEFMYRAYKPFTEVVENLEAKALPGPLLAYGDCRLGILKYKICRHLGFFKEDPIMPPGSLQSKMFKLVGASALVRGVNLGTVNLMEDQEMQRRLGPDLLRASSDALTMFKKAKLLVPTFDVEHMDSQALAMAKSRAEAFLFAASVRSKELLRDEMALMSKEELAAIEDFLQSVSATLQKPESLIETPPANQQRSEGDDDNSSAEELEMRDAVTNIVNALIGPNISQQVPRLPSSSPAFLNSQAKEAPSPHGKGSSILEPIITHPTFNSFVSFVTGGQSSSPRTSPPAENNTLQLTETENKIQDLLSRIPEHVEAPF